MSVHHRKGANPEKVSLPLHCLFPETTGCSLGFHGSCSVWRATVQPRSVRRLVVDHLLLESSIFASILR